jgi:hypothetical protein
MGDDLGFILGLEVFSVVFLFLKDLIRHLILRAWDSCEKLPEAS